MHRPFRLAVLLVAAPALSGAATWQFARISDSLPRTTADVPRQDLKPCTGPTRVGWVGHWSGQSALVLYDGLSASYLTPPPTRAVLPIPLLRLGREVLPTQFNSYQPGPLTMSLWQPAIAFSANCLLPPEPGEYPRFFASEEIFFWQEGTIHRITDDTLSDTRPSLYHGTIAWQSRPGDGTDDWEIRYWDGYGVRQITDNDVDDTAPSIYERTIAWRSGTGIVYVSVPSSVYNLVPAPVVVGPGEWPSIFKNKIAYQASDGNDTEIFLYDIDTGRTTQITDNDYNDRYPCLHDGTLVWEAFDALDRREVLYWDGKTAQQITDNEAGDTQPSLWGTGLGTRIAYVERPPECLQPHFTSGLDISLDTSVVLARPAATLAPGPGTGEVRVTWPSLEGRAYRVEYSDDLVNWHVAADPVPSAGYGTTSWTDGPASGTVPAPSEVPRRFYRVAENQ